MLSKFNQKYNIKISKKFNTEKRTDPTIVARATTYSGKVVRIVHVFSDEALAEYAEHCKKWKKTQEKNCTRMRTRTINFTKQAICKTIM